MASKNVAPATESTHSLNIVTLRPDNRIREQRRRTGLTLEQLAARVGIQPALLHRFENERDCPELKFDRARAIAKALGCRFIELVAVEDLA